LPLQSAVWVVSFFGGATHHDQSDHRREFRASSLRKKYETCLARQAKTTPVRDLTLRESLRAS
jgi:hypothetical protein